MSQIPLNNNCNNTSSHLDEEENNTYRLVQKTYQCQDCHRIYKHLDPTLEHVAPPCPNCQALNSIQIEQNHRESQQVASQQQEQEHSSSQSSSNSAQNSQQQSQPGQQSDQNSSGRVGFSISSLIQRYLRGETLNNEEMITLSLILSLSSSRRENQNQQNNQQTQVEGQNNEEQRRREDHQSQYIARVVRYTFENSNGTQTEIEQIFDSATNHLISERVITRRLRQPETTSSQSQPSQSNHISTSNSNQENDWHDPTSTDQQRRSSFENHLRNLPAFLIFTSLPAFMFGEQLPDQSQFNSNFNQNFRSNLGDDLLQFILNMTLRQYSGRVGTPPASSKIIESLPEVNIDEKYCKTDENSQITEYPRCAICYDDLTMKGTLMPCGHLYDKECISKWLKEHNQCPVCRYELQTDDTDYEAQKQKKANNTYNNNNN